MTFEDVFLYSVSGNLYFELTAWTASDEVAQTPPYSPSLTASKSMHWILTLELHILLNTSS